jgi:hypothetical protein
VKLGGNGAPSIHSSAHSVDALQLPCIQIPTFRATPLHPECDNYCEFPVADRPNAVQQWIDAVAANPSLLKGAWVFLVECDYVWMKPIVVSLRVVD